MKTDTTQDVTIPAEVVNDLERSNPRINFEYEGKLGKSFFVPGDSKIQIIVNSPDFANLILRGFDSNTGEEQVLTLVLMKKGS